ncbi:MAG: 4-alpha-glucanotransferase [Chloroflexota bacterium]|nr:MAG: 4-alpha-glucanotransferase [Chloroflexota bacterium]
MINIRSSGILLHPTSLPGPYGIGDLGPQARNWVDFLSKSGTGLWQVLPLGPTGFGDSPYQCFSAIAGNPYLISPDDLVEEGLLHPNDLTNIPDFPSGSVDFGNVIYWKMDLLHKSYEQFRHAGKKIHKEAGKFYSEQEEWLNDYALFMALKEFHGGKPWASWPAIYRDRDPEALELFKEDRSHAVHRQKFYQYLFYKQWNKLKEYANQQGIKIIGDIPIFIAHDSADAWTNRDLLYIGDDGQPTVVAGVPPDYFSETGQLWGNPLYRWDVHARDNYQWWIKRLKAVFSMVDIVRLDHFRGFANYWEIPAGEKTAINGRWVDGPGADFLTQVHAEFGKLPIIAEDLGEISPEVYKLRDQFNLPGMKILVFAFDSGETNEFLPHHYPENCVVYTGTHDNDTAVGWFKRIGEGEKTFAQRYLQTSGEDIAWDLIKAAWSSKAVYAISPLQDLLNLDNQARMNYPGNPQGNWKWRFFETDLNDELKEKLHNVNSIFGRSTC